MILALARILLENSAPNLLWHTVINSFKRPPKFRFSYELFSEQILAKDFMIIPWLLLLTTVSIFWELFLSSGISLMERLYAGFCSESLKSMMSWVMIYPFSLELPCRSFKYSLSTLLISYLEYNLWSILFTIAISSPRRVSKTATVFYKIGPMHYSSTTGKTYTDFWRMFKEFIKRPGFLSSIWSIATAKYFLMFWLVSNYWGY